MRRSRSPLSGDEGLHDEMMMDDGADGDMESETTNSTVANVTGEGGGGGGGMSQSREDRDNCIKRKKKTRTVFSRSQVFQLETTFDMKRYLSSSERAALASSLRLTETQVNLLLFIKIIVKILFCYKKCFCIR